MEEANIPQTINQTEMAAKALVRTPDKSVAAVNKRVEAGDARKKLENIGQENKQITEAEAQEKIEKITPDRNIQYSVLRMARMCEIGFERLHEEDQEILVGNIAKDLPNIEIFKALQGKDSATFGTLGKDARPGYIQDLLKNPKVTGLIRKRIQEVLNDAKTGGGELSQINKDVVKLNEKIDKNQKEGDVNRNASSVLKKSISEYESTMLPVGPEGKLELVKGKQIEAMEELQGHIDEEQLELGRLQKINEVVLLIDKKTDETGAKAVAINIDGEDKYLRPGETVKEFMAGEKYAKLLKDIEEKKAIIKKNKETLEGHKKREQGLKDELAKKEEEEAVLKAEKQDLDNQLEEKIDEYGTKEEDVLKNEEELRKRIAEIPKSAYKELLLQYNGEVGEMIKTGRGLADKRSNDLDRARYIKKSTSLWGRETEVEDRKAMKDDLEKMKKSKPGESVDDIGKRQIQTLLDDDKCAPALREWLLTVVKVDSEGKIKLDDQGKVDYANKEEFDRFAKDTTVRRLSIIAVQNPDLLKSMFTKDELFAKTIYNDALPGIIKNVFEKNEYAESKKELEKIGITSSNAESVLNKFKNNWWVLALILGAIGGIGLMASKS